MKITMKNTTIALFFGLALAATPNTAMAATGASVQTGATAPDFPIHLANGVSGRLADLRGHVVVLDFWASWCPWCVKELPDVNAISRSGDALVVGIDDEDAPTIAKATTALQVAFPTVTDANDSIEDLYGVTSFPHTVVIDAQGKVSAVIDGYHDDDTLARAVQSALAK